MRDFRVRGNTAIDSGALLSLAEPYRNRPVSNADLQRLRDDITRMYVEAGFVTARAVLPESLSPDGALELTVVEGGLTQVDVSGSRYFRGGVLRRRFSAYLNRPINVYALEDELQMLQQDERIRHVDAELLPAGGRGGARLAVSVEEERPYSASIAIDNHVSPAVAERRLSLSLRHDNVTGAGDVASLAFDYGEGVRAIDVSYGVPLFAPDTTLRLGVRSSTTHVIEAPFDRFDIESRSATYAVALERVLHRSPRSRFALVLGAEHRRSRSFLLGTGFPFADGVEADGTSKLTVVSFGQDWVASDRRQVLSLRSSFRAGIGALRATVHPDGRPDGRFVVWRGQAQWARRLPSLEATFLVRAEVQLSNDPLLGLEQFSFGGSTSVRGYRESVFVRDNGWVGSLELRRRLPFRIGRTGGLEARMFFDVGRAWNENRPTPSERTLASCGLGLVLRHEDGWRVEIGWAEDLRKLDSVGDAGSLQDAGLRFRVARSF